MTKSTEIAIFVLLICLPALPVRAFYRFSQFLRAVFGRITPDERAFAAQYLTPGELRLFAHMPRFDQRHCLDVAHTLRRGGHTHALLLRAALIHDCGKVDDCGRAIPLVYYGAFVVLQRLAPDLYRWAARRGRGPLWPFAVHAVHEQRSIALAQAAGSPPELLTILRDYATQQATPAAQALRWADEQN